MLGNDSGPFPSSRSVTDKPSAIPQILKKELALFTGLLFVGFVLLPIAVWFVGKAVFGAYGGSGFAEFFGQLSGKIGSGDIVAWFLVLSPWLTWQVLRLAALGWRVAGKV